MELAKEAFMELFPSGKSAESGKSADFLCSGKSSKDFLGLLSQTLLPQTFLGSSERTNKNVNDYEFRIRYTGKFKPYNANVRYSKNSMQFNLSKKWKGISREIQIGLMQGLMLRIFKEKNKIKTLNMELYDHFMRSIHISAPKINSDSILEESFNRVNENHFFGMMEKPNLVRHNSARRLGSYEYGSDTISISEILLSDIKVLDYVMYHEMLHKKFKYSSDNGRTCHHSREFKEEEKKFENSSEMERKIKGIIRNNKK